MNKNTKQFMSNLAQHQDELNRRKHAMGSAEWDGPAHSYDEQPAMSAKQRKAKKYWDGLKKGTPSLNPWWDNNNNGGNGGNGGKQKGRGKGKGKKRGKGGK